MTEAIVKPSFQKLIESVEALPIEDREMLVKIIKARIIEKRRDELVSDMKESLIAYKRSGVHFGAVYDLMRDLIEDLRD